MICSSRFTLFSCIQNNMEHKNRAHEGVKEMLEHMIRIKRKRPEVVKCLALYLEAAEEVIARAAEVKRKEEKPSTVEILKIEALAPLCRPKSKAPRVPLCKAVPNRVSPEGARANVPFASASMTPPTPTSAPTPPTAEKKTAVSSPTTPTPLPSHHDHSHQPRKLRYRRPICR